MSIFAVGTCKNKLYGGYLDSGVKYPVKAVFCFCIMVEAFGRYQRLARKLIHLSHKRLDFIFIVSLISQFMHPARKVQ